MMCLHVLQTKAAAQQAAATVKSQTPDNPIEALKNKINEASVTNNSPQVQLDKVCASDGLRAVHVSAPLGTSICTACHGKHHKIAPKRFLWDVGRSPCQPYIHLCICAVLHVVRLFCFNWQYLMSSMADSDR